MQPFIVSERRRLCTREAKKGDKQWSRLMDAKMREHASITWFFLSSNVSIELLRFELSDATSTLSILFPINRLIDCSISRVIFACWTCQPNRLVRRYRCLDVVMSTDSTAHPMLLTTRPETQFYWTITIIAAGADKRISPQIIIIVFVHF